MPTDSTWSEREKVIRESIGDNQASVDTRVKEREVEVVSVSLAPITDLTWKDREAALRERIEKEGHWSNRRDIGMPEERGWHMPDDYNPKAKPNEQGYYDKSHPSPKG